MKPALVMTLFIFSVSLAPLQAESVLEFRFNQYHRTLQNGSYKFFYLHGKKRNKIKSNQIQLFHKTYYHLLFKQPMPPVEIIIFPRKSSFLKHTNVPEGYQAFYLTGQKAVVTYDSGNIGVLQHEIVHHWIQSNIRGNLPLWFEEGLASLFESPIYSNGNIKYFHTNERHEKLKGKKWTHLEKFMKTVDLPNDHDKAQARLIFLWLADQNLLYKFVQAYSDNVDFDPSGIESLEEVTGKKIAELNGFLEMYSKKQH